MTPRHAREIALYIYIYIYIYNKIKIYRQELRDFINRLLNDEIKCNLIDDDFEEKYFPKLILDG